MATMTEEKLMKDVTPSVLRQSEVPPHTFSGKCVRIEVFKSVNKYKFKFKETG